MSTHNHPVTDAALPTTAKAKALAKELRTARNAVGEDITHSQSLELIAEQFGYRDWNGLIAAIGVRAPAGWAAGSRVRGRFMSQPFEARVLKCEALESGWFRLTLDLDEAIDVVTFESFSNLRKRLTKTVGPQGTTREKDGDGRPHLELEM